MTGLAAAGTAWMVDAACAQRLDLPWTLDANQVGTWERVTMTVVCDRCHARPACSSYADQVGANSGFWAGSYRDTGTLAAEAVAAAPSWVASPLPELPELPELDGAA